VQTLVSSSHSHLKFLKVLKNTTCFGQYGHPQVLKFLVGETAAIVSVPSMHMYVVLGVLLPVAFSCLFCFLITLRLTISQSVSLGVEPHLGIMTRYLLLFDSYRLVFVGQPL
jgi:hypothetical protein